LVVAAVEITPVDQHQVQVYLGVQVADQVKVNQTRHLAV
jgi:hypothetical protein